MVTAGAWEKISHSQCIKSRLISLELRSTAEIDLRVSRVGHANSFFERRSSERRLFSRLSSCPCVPRSTFGKLNGQATAPTTRVSLEAVREEARSAREAADALQAWRSALENKANADLEAARAERTVREAAEAPRQQRTAKARGDPVEKDFRSARAERTIQEAVEAPSRRRTVQAQDDAEDPDLQAIREDLQVPPSLRRRDAT